VYEYLLPVGSVVKVTNVVPKLMVIGILQKSKTRTKPYDYLAVAYPEGQFDQRLNVGFDHDDVEEVVHRGYEDDDRTAFMVALELTAQKVTQSSEE
jgi:Uncharacterized protein conserved in bacteria